jgi:hypothetical protein
MQPDTELDTWRRKWQTQGSVSPDLKRRVEGEIRKRQLDFIASVAVTVIIGGSTSVWAIVSGRAEVVVLVVAVWVFIAVVWTISRILDRRRGGWRPASVTTAAFLDFSILNCRARRQEIAAAAVLYTAFLMFVLGWKYQELAKEAPLDLWAYLTSWRVTTAGLITFVLCVLAVRRRRRLKRELQNLLTLRQQLAPSSQDSNSGVGKHPSDSGGRRVL